MKPSWKKGTFGVLAEFDSPDQLVQAVKAAKERGYLALDTFTPFGIEELAEPLELERFSRPVARNGLIWGLFGAGLALYWQLYDNLVSYRMNVAGRAYFAWPTYILPTMDIMLFITALAIFITMLRVSGVPRFRHPLFDLPKFGRASIDRFFLLIKAEDSLYDPVLTVRFLETLNPLACDIVAADPWGENE